MGPADPFSIKPTVPFRAIVLPDQARAGGGVLERIVSRWKSYDPSCQIEIPRTSGVYVFIGDGKVLYVGSSTIIRPRVAQYWCRRGYHPDDGWMTPWGNPMTLVLKCKTGGKYGQWLMDEVRLIRRLKPAGNKSHNPKRSERAKVLS